MSQCKYCGSKQYGACSKSPHKKHEHSGGSSDQCVWCGSKQPGGSCPFSPTKRHER